MRIKKALKGSQKIENQFIIIYHLINYIYTE